VSTVAHFAEELHRRFSQVNDKPLHPIPCAARNKTLQGIKAVVFDLYGTLINYWLPGFEKQEVKQARLREAFAKTARRFAMVEALERINSANPYDETLQDFYHGLIAVHHDRKREQGISFPEIQIEEIWRAILLMLQRHGYDYTGLQLGSERETAQCMAFFYNFHALGRGLYPGVVSCLQQLKKRGIQLGIISNAQFYTPIDLTLFLYDQSEAQIQDHLDVFNTRLSFYSYEYGVAKPNPLLVQKLYDALYDYSILPEQTLFVGNDLMLDIRFASEHRLATALFTGDRDVTFFHDQRDTVVPDICFDRWDTLPDMLVQGEQDTT
jgi:putative hydrolase of the HAD superfamily